MSFILDALKKSESERKRQDTPGIASIPDAGRQNPPARWPWVVAGLLTINLVVLAAIMLRPETPVELQPTDVTPPPATSGTTNPVPNQAMQSQPARAVPVEQPRAGSTVSASEISAPATQTMRQPVEMAVETPAPTITDGLPTLRELIAAGQMQLPDMHLDIHVYSGQPADRFVFVNMTKYKEGATLTEGPSITEITPDGVVLDYFGTRFLLPRE